MTGVAALHTARRCALIGLVVASACGGEGREDGPDERRGATTRGLIDAAAETRGIVDAAGDTLRLSLPPERIVSLVPAVTRIVAELGEGARLVGRTRYDTAAAFADLPSVGEGMGPDWEALVALEPDLVVYFHGASDPDTPAQLARLGIRRFAVRPDDLDDVIALHHTLGVLLDRASRATALTSKVEAELDAVRTAVAGLGHPGVAYLLDGAPPWAAGPGTWIGQLVILAGGRLLPTDLPP
ncbi:MAG: ABC transporter substrate-binding protein, partial [Longimicrobiales bacterium]|nr:ABC transporter substrate-binding protein [Longimicrobiales bacterium]